MYKQKLCFIYWTYENVIHYIERKLTLGIRNGVVGKLGEIVGEGQVEDFVKAEHLLLILRKSTNVQFLSTAFNIKKSQILNGVMKITVLTLKFCVLIMALVLATGCSQTKLNNDSKSTGVREDVLSMGITFINEMKDSVNNGDMEIKGKIDDLAYELKVICVENNDYKNFSDKEMEFVDTLGEIRIAYDEVVLTRNPKFNKSEKKREAALDNFNQLVSTFDRNYTN